MHLFAPSLSKVFVKGEGGHTLLVCSEGKGMQIFKQLLNVQFCSQQTHASIYVDLISGMQA